MYRNRFSPWRGIRRSNGLGPLAWALVVLAGCSAASSRAADPGSASPAGVRVRVAEGVLVGEQLEGGVTVYRGVPFAEAPVGDRRWRPPSAPRAWPGARDATAFAPACPQDHGTPDYYRRAASRLGRDTTVIPPLGPTSEDCLYLNLWTPAAGTDRRLPVLVWVHGGAGTSGTASDPLFDGAALARRGLVVVTVAYRLGALGFLAHPALSNDDPRGVSGNYALLDLVQALEWIRRNGPAFGGNPGRVTLAGQSAGATLAQLLMVSPVANGLFHRLVAHSGSGLVTLRPLRPGAAPDTINAAETRGRRYVNSLGLDPSVDAATLRRVPADSLVAATRRTPADAPVMPVVDGVVLLAQPSDAFARGAYARVPILTGSTDDEVALFMPPVSVEPEEHREWIRQRFGADADLLLQVYPADDDGEVTRRQRVRLITDDAFRASTLLLLRWTEGRSPVYLYRFGWRPDDGAVGGFHGADLPFLFDTHGLWWSRDGDVGALSETMQTAWARFAATGVPAAPKLPHWPAAAPSMPAAMVLDAAPRVAPLPRLEALRRFAEALAGRLTGQPQPR